MIYLDSAATSRYYVPVKDFFKNPHANHALGIKAQKEMNRCREIIKKYIHVNEGIVIFGYSSTDLANRLFNHSKVVGNGVFIFGDEHESFYQYDNPICTSYVFQIQTLVNNITGIKKPLVRKMENTFVIADYTAAIHHMVLPDNAEEYYDAIIASGHKFNGPQGTGFMWISDRLQKYLGGNICGNNEYGFVPGTPNVNGIFAMTGALTKDDYTYIYSEDLLKSLKTVFNRKNIEYKIIGENTNKIAAINAIYLPGINADALTNYLSTKAIYISPGHSACAEASDYRVLNSYGLTNEEAACTIRISFDSQNNYGEINELAKEISYFTNKFVK